MFVINQFSTKPELWYHITTLKRTVHISSYCHDSKDRYKTQTQLTKNKRNIEQKTSRFSPIEKGVLY